MLLELTHGEPISNEDKEARKIRNSSNGTPESSSLVIGFIALMTVLLAVYGLIFISLKIMHCKREDQAFRHSRMFEEEIGCSRASSESVCGSVESVDDGECI